MNKYFSILIACMLNIHSYAQQAGRVYDATEAFDGEGAEVLRLFPSSVFKHADPFILLDDFSVTTPAGFPAHEHKGFEAITYMIAGGFVHKDNIGNADTIVSGQAQRFTAGRGLIHSEMPGTNGVNKGLQLWLNIPVDIKQVQPSYQLIEFLPVTYENDSTRIVRTVVGEGSTLKVNCGCDLSYTDIQLKNNSIDLAPKEGYTSFIYVLDGAVQLNDVTVSSGQFYFLQLNEQIEIKSVNARFVYLSAKPLHKPIKQRGPYVY